MAVLLHSHKLTISYNKGGEHEVDILGDRGELRKSIISTDSWKIDIYGNRGTVRHSVSFQDGRWYYQTIHRAGNAKTKYKWINPDGKRSCNRLRFPETIPNWLWKKVNNIVNSDKWRNAPDIGDPYKPGWINPHPRRRDRRIYD